MLVTVDKLNIKFEEDIPAMEDKLKELKRLEEAVENSPYFKLLSGKTQMIGKNKGKSKKERSRLLHTNTIANGVVKPIIEKIYDRIEGSEGNTIFTKDDYYKKIFELNREIAITRGMIMAKAHDIGHVAFGHEGERAINEFFSKIDNKEDIDAVLKEHLKYFGEDYEEYQGHTTKELLPVVKLSFEHNELSAILLNYIIENNGIQITEEDRKALTLGVLGHSTSRTGFDQIEKDICAQATRAGDKVEYINADYDEVNTLIKVDSELQEYLNKSISLRIEENVDNLVNEAFSKGKIFEKNPTMADLSKINKSYNKIQSVYDPLYSYTAVQKIKEIKGKANHKEELNKYYQENPVIEALYSKENVNDLYNIKFLFLKGGIQGENSDRISLMYKKLLQYYYNHQEEIPDKITREVTPIDHNQTSFEIEHKLDTKHKHSPLQKTLEYISLMDDESMVESYKTLVEQRIEKGEKYGIEPISIDETREYCNSELKKALNRYVAKRMEDEGELRNAEQLESQFIMESTQFIMNNITKSGKETLLENYTERFKEYAEDLKYCNRMYEADKRRASQNINERQAIQFGSIVHEDESATGNTTGHDEAHKIGNRQENTISETIKSVQGNGYDKNTKLELGNGGYR
jgi:hypothetical protein